MREHLNSLRKNKHHSIHLQKAWNLYGESVFVFRILEKDVPREIIRKREKYWINKLDTLNREHGYNMSESTINFSASGENHPLYGKKGIIQSYWKGKKLPEYIKAKMRKPKSEQGRKNMSLNHADVSGKNNPMYGKTLTKEHREKISKSLIGLMAGENHPMYGTKRSGELAGHKKRVVQLSLNGEYIKEYINITEAAKATGAIRQHISKCCKGERKQTGGYRWKYAE